MANKFQKAKREKLWLKILLGGVAGCGKTYSALRLATGIYSKCGGEGIAAIDTENGRIRYYANEFDFDDMQLDEDHRTPEDYIDAIDNAVDSGYKVLIIDSVSHEWDYLMEIHSKMPGNSYTNFNKITPRDNAFQEKILQSPIHIISTVRGKTAYTLEDKNGKQQPKKVGIGFKQRENNDFNYTVVLNIDQQTHIPTVEKDNTHIFEGKYDVLTEKHGEALYNWANSGEGDMPKPVVKEKTTGEASELDDVKESIGSLIEALKNAGIDRKNIIEKIGENNITNGKRNPDYTKITDLDTAKNVLTTLESLM